MELRENNVLITGGGSGIGFEFARVLVARGNRVMICGRDVGRLARAVDAIPGLLAVQADVATADGRARLLDDALRLLPDLDVLVNNAGIQRRQRFGADTAPWADRAQEIAINFEAPVHLCALFLPHLRQRPGAAIVNVSSGLAFLPVTFAPVYAATKAALHSFSQALRAELRGTAVVVVEIVPPMVNTDLGGSGLHGDGVPVSLFVDDVVGRMLAGEIEIGHGMSDMFRNAGRVELEAIAARLNG